MVRIYSLKGLLLGHDLAFLVLIIVTGAMGWVGVDLRQQAAEESLRLSTLINLVQETRGDVYRQMTEVFDHHFLADPRAITRYRTSGLAIAANLARIEDVARQPAEHAAIEGLRLAYAQVRQQTDDVMTTPSTALQEPDHLTVFFTADLQMSWLDDYEKVFAANDDLLTIAQQAEQNRVSTLARNAGLVLLIPIATAAALLLVARGFMQRAFVRPINALLEGVSAYGKGRLDHQVPEIGAAELVTLERAVNRMAQDLAASREALVRSEKQAALGSLVPVVAHNIRNPLASIRAMAQLYDGPGISSDISGAMRDIRGTVDRLERWLSSLLSYLNPLRLARVDVRIAEVVDQAALLLAPRLDAKRIWLSRHGWEAEYCCLLDVHLMEQAIYGLLTNAAEASPEGGRLALSLRRVAAEVVLTIADQGPGMPFRPSPDDLNPGPTTKSFGSGLGIPFAFKVCDLHHGRIEFGVAAGGGTEVTISLPIVQPARSAA